MKENEHIKLDEDIFITSDGILAEIEISKLKQILGGNWEETLKKNETSHEVLL